MNARERIRRRLQADGEPTKPAVVRLAPDVVSNLRALAVDMYSVSDLGALGTLTTGQWRRLLIELERVGRYAAEQHQLLNQADAAQSDLPRGVSVCVRCLQAACTCGPQKPFE